VAGGLGIWGNYYALIIGINEYKEWPRLQTAVNDAIGVKEILIDRYNLNEENVILRLDDSAHRLELLRDLRNLASNLQEHDNLLIYYGGHGQIDDLTGDGYVRKMGKELKIDAVFLCNIDIIPWDPDPSTYKVFMVDVHSGKIYQSEASTRDIESNGEKLFKKTAQKVISEYMRNQ